MSWSAGETVLTRSESGYLSANDASPTTYTSTTSFDGRHRMVAGDGPRTEAADVTTRSYYADGDADPMRRGRLREVTDGVGLVRAFDEYDVYGTARAMTDPNGVVTRVTTDARGRVRTTTIEPVAGDPNEAAAYVSTSEYDGRDRLVEATRPRGNRMRYGYEEGTNRLTDTILVDENGNERERRHVMLNAVGGKTSEEDQICAVPGSPCGSWITRRSEAFVYDEHNRLEALLHPVPAGSKTVYTYDADGKVLGVQDENHTSANTTYGYDALDRLTSVTQKLATAAGGVAVTRYDYDVLDDLTAVTDPNGNVTRYAYDDFRRMVRQESPVTGVTTYGYDAAGNLTTTTDARGAETTRVYDALGRIRSAATTLGGNTETVSWAYDDPAAGSYGKGRLRAMTDPSGETVYAYERRGLLREEGKTILGDVYTTLYRYDANGNRSTIVYPSGREVTYGFDYADRAVSASGVLGAASTGYVSNATYEPFGPETSLVYAAGSLRRATYDARYRLTGFTVLAGTTPLADYGYGNDAVGNITAITDRLDPGYSRSFGYDDLNRLTQANTGSALWGTGSYAYDALGNRVSATIGANGSSYAYQGTTSKLASVTENGATSTVSYDPAGNEQQAGLEAFAYSPRNHLDRDAGWRYVYDGSGVRVSQVSLTPGPRIVTQPQSRPVCPGGSVTLTVSAIGASSYQWQVLNGANWTDITGGSGASVVVTPAAPTQYRVIVSNAAASTTSDVATVTPVAVATEPGSGTLYGDVNHDAAVDGNDVTVLRAVLAGNAALTVPSAVADLNGDGAIDALDLALLGAYAAQTITCLPQFATTSGALSIASALNIEAGSTVAPNQTAPNPTQHFFYTPERGLLSRTELRAGGGTPLPAADIIWFNGRPVAEERIAGAETRLTFTDHLGTPFLQTSAAGDVVWRAEYEPYGEVFAMRSGGATDQLLRFAGQEAQVGAELAYNIFRWYRAGWGRYTQSDPYLQPSAEEPNQYGYAKQDPLRFKDALGLFSIDSSCDCGKPLGQNLYAAAAKACSYSKKPACADLLKKLVLGGQPLDQCLAKRCSDDTPIKCKKIDGDSWCGSYSALSNTIYLFSGNAGCPSQKGLGYGPTIFHEAIHSCGLYQEPYKNQPLSDAFNKIMEVCAGYKEK